MKQKITPFKTRWKYALLALMAFLLFGAGKAKAAVLPIGEPVVIADGETKYYFLPTSDGTLRLTGADPNNSSFYFDWIKYIFEENGEAVSYTTDNGQGGTYADYSLTANKRYYYQGSMAQDKPLLFTYTGTYDPNPEPGSGEGTDPDNPDPGKLILPVPGENLELQNAVYTYTAPENGWLKIIYSQSPGENNLYTSEDLTPSTVVEMAPGYNQQMEIHLWPVIKDQIYYFNAEHLVQHDAGQVITVTTSFEVETDEPEPEPEVIEIQTETTYSITSTSPLKGYYTAESDGVLTATFSEANGNPIIYGPFEEIVYTDESFSNVYGASEFPSSSQQYVLTEGKTYYIHAFVGDLIGTLPYNFNVIFSFEKSQKEDPSDEPVEIPANYLPAKMDYDYILQDGEELRLYITPSKEGELTIIQTGSTDPHLWSQVNENLDDFTTGRIEGDHTTNGNVATYTYNLQAGTTYFFYGIYDKSRYLELKQVRFAFSGDLDSPKEKESVSFGTLNAQFEGYYNYPNTFEITVSPQDALSKVEILVYKNDDLADGEDYTLEDMVLINDIVKYITLKSVGNYRIVAQISNDNVYQDARQEFNYVVKPEVYDIPTASIDTEWNMEKIEISVESYTSTTGAFLSTNSDEFTYSVKPLFDTEAKGEYKPGEEGQKQRLLDNGYELSHIDAEYYSIETIDVEDNDDGSISLNIHFPCSGVYEVWAHAKSDNVYFSGDDKDDALLATVNVYPSFNNQYVIGYDDERGKDIIETFNINGIPSTEGKYGLEIQYPYLKDENGNDILVNQDGLGRSQFYNPGTYFSDLYFKWTNETTRIRAERASVSPLATNDDIDASLISQGYEKFDGTNLNLEFLKDEGTQKTLHVVAVKNGASTPVNTSGNSDAMFAVSSSKDYDVPTGVGEITVNGSNGTVEYYDLNGVKVNPENLVKGIYIKVENGKASKVAI